MEPNATIMAVDVAGVLDRVTDTTGQPLRPPQSFVDLEKFVTSEVNDGDAFVGDWSNLLIGVRTELVIEASREAADASSSAFRNLQVFVRAYLRADVAVARADAFVVLDNVGARS